MDKLSTQQQIIVDAPLDQICVVACAGSGKTKTAVERLAKVREKLGSSRSHVALLSFSNVAVSTFRKIYSEKKGLKTYNRVTIDTFDGFITSNILRPHAYRTMGCEGVPFLLCGSERFLKNKELKYWYETSKHKRSVEGVDLKHIAVNYRNDQFEFNFRAGDKKYLTNNGYQVTQRLGRYGAYTHELGKFWALLTLVQQPEILRVIANRYSHIIVDEAQDVGELHQQILELLIEKGVKVSLIGDPNQAIYEFADATGEFITSFDSKTENSSFDLSTNYRSIPEIIDVANSISGRKDEPGQMSDNNDHGAYYMVYDALKAGRLVDCFERKIKQFNLSLSNSAVLFRAKSGIGKIRNESRDIGQGKIKMLALAAIHREKYEYQKAYELLVSCIVGLLDDTPDNLAYMLLNSSKYPEVRDMRQDIWLFLRSADNGLPSAFIEGTAWHSIVKDKLITLLDNINKSYGYPKVSKIGNILSKKKLTEEPLLLTPNSSIDKKISIRLDTVHQTKGESLDAVLYVATKPQIDGLLNGVETEVGRIGYVAVTRARKFFVLGVPTKAFKSLEPNLKAIGLRELK